MKMKKIYPNFNNKNKTKLIREKEKKIYLVKHKEEKTFMKIYRRKT